MIATRRDISLVSRTALNFSAGLLSNSWRIFASASTAPPLQVDIAPRCCRISPKWIWKSSGSRSVTAKTFNRYRGSVGICQHAACNPATCVAVAREAEGRQITVMFWDIVGSTVLASRLDQEDPRELIGRHHARVAQIVSQLDGFAAKYMGTACWPTSAGQPHVTGAAGRLSKGPNA